MKPIPPTPPGVKTAWADAAHMRLVRGLIEGWTDRPELVARQHSADPGDPWAGEDRILVSPECKQGNHRDCDGVPCEDWCHTSDMPGVAA